MHPTRAQLLEQYEATDLARQGIGFDQALASPVLHAALSAAARSRCTHLARLARAAGTHHRQPREPA